MGKLTLMNFGGSPRVRASVLVAAVVVAAGALSFARPPLARRAPSSSLPVAASSPLPETLAGTGLYADFEARTIASENRPFAPQYPLWTDGARKRRWIYLPKGSVIDASNSDGWQFPVGTKVWKEFSFGRPVETRFIERTTLGWRFASYVWSEDGTKATLAPERGQIAPGVEHQIPSISDCRVCHANATTPLLGFGELQLSADRDPNAIHAESVPAGALNLEALAMGGWLRGFSGSTSPRIAARTPTERSALGYLHANCGMCHRSDGPLASLEMVLASSSAQPMAALDTTVGRPSRMTPDRFRIAGGEPDRSLLVDRMRSRSPLLQMPPLGTQFVDEDAVRLMTAWIDELPN